VVGQRVEGEETVKLKVIVKAMVKEKQKKNIIYSYVRARAHTQQLAQTFHIRIL
jgi:hypothetical protein